MEERSSLDCWKSKIAIVSPVRLETLSTSDLADTIPKLYSSRIYKDFLKTQKVPNNRIPSYLQQVDSPKSPDSPKEKSSSPSPRKGVKIADEAES